MKTGRWFIISCILLIVAACFVPAGTASGDSDSNAIAANKDNAPIEGVSNQGVACNWKGWRSSIPEARCIRWPCDRYVETLRIKCVDGFLTEVKVAVICEACQEPPGL